MAWVRQYSAPNVVRARKLKALIFYTINPLLYEKWPLYVFEPLLGGLGQRTLFVLGSLESPASLMDFLLVIIELFSPGAFVLSQCTGLTDGRLDFIRPTLFQFGFCRVVQMYV